MDQIIKKIKALAIHHETDIQATIAKYILNNTSQIITTDIRSLARACFVSTATVTRFCQALGLSGFNELKYILRGAKLITEPENNTCGVDAGLQEYLQLKAQNAIHVYNLFNQQQPEFCHYITPHNNTYIFCFNVAYFATKNFVQRMRGLSYNLQLESDVSAIDWYIDIIKPDDLVIFISLSGTNPILQKYAELIRGKCHTTAIVGEQNNFQTSVDEIIPLMVNPVAIWDIYSLHAQTLQQLWDFTYHLFLTKHK